eukprot:1161802-Pelagomonas_calceolata.AAC.7
MSGVEAKAQMRASIPTCTYGLLHSAIYKARRSAYSGLQASQGQGHWCMWLHMNCVVGCAGAGGDGRPNACMRQSRQQGVHICCTSLIHNCVGDMQALWLHAYGGVFKVIKEKYVGSACIAINEGKGDTRCPLNLHVLDLRLPGTKNKCTSSHSDMSTDLHTSIEMLICHITPGGRRRGRTPDGRTS